MSENKDGGFIYPSNTHDLGSGITRRDWLAGLAMQALIGSEHHMDSMLKIIKERNLDVDSSIAKMSYVFSDAMIAESNK